MQQDTRDSGLFEAMERDLSAAVLSDILDHLGLREHTLSGSIRPLAPGLVLAGRAAPMILADTFAVEPDPYRLAIEAIDRLRASDVVLLYSPGSSRAAIWGELFSTAARGRGARGAILDGLCRDVEKIVEMRFPVFARGTCPLDSAGRQTVVNYDCRVKSGDAEILPGDILFADSDGIVAIPQRAEQEVIANAFEKARTENMVRDALQKGMTLRQAWDTYGVL